MTIEFFVHTGQIEEMNERRALCRTARRLHEQYHKAREHYCLIANISPDHDAKLRNNLTQLDALLLGPGFIAIIDFKNYFDPITAVKPEDTWYVLIKRGRRKKRVPIRGGNKKSPFLQGRSARRALHSFLQAYDPHLLPAATPQLPYKSWQALHFFLLFHPVLHPNSRLPHLGKDDYWFHIAGVPEIAELLYATGVRDFLLTPAKMRELARDCFGASPWPEMTRMIQEEIGYLILQQPDSTIPERHRVWPYDDFTIGRTSRLLQHRIPISRRYKNISRSQTRVSVEGQLVYLHDLGSKNGTWIEGVRVDEKTGKVLHAAKVAHLGGRGEDAIRIWYEPRIDTTTSTDSGADRTITH